MARYRARRRIPEGDDRPLKKYGFGRLWYVVTTHGGKLFLVNLLAVLFSLPVVTAPAAWTALHAVVQQYYRTGYGEVWPKFWSEFKTAFVPRLLISCVLLLLPVLGWLVGGQFSEGLAFGVCAFFLVLDILVMGWWYPQMSILKIGPALTLRNAFLLIFIAGKQNVLLILISVIVAALVALLWPVSVILILLFLPVLAALLITDVVNPVLDERLIKEEKNETDVPS